MCMFVSFIVICRGENFKYKNTKINSQQKQQQQQEGKIKRESNNRHFELYIVIVV